MVNTLTPEAARTLRRLQNPVISERQRGCVNCLHMNKGLWKDPVVHAGACEPCNDAKVNHQRYHYAIGPGSRWEYDENKNYN